MTGTILGALLGLSLAVAVRCTLVACARRREPLPAAAPPTGGVGSSDAGRRPVGLLVAILVVAVGVIGGERLGSHRVAPPSASVLRQFGPARDAVCDAATAAAEGDRDLARRIFVERSQQSLTDLAAVARSADATAAASLLEAKSAVEAALERDYSATAVDLEALAAATGRAIAAVEGMDPGPCP